jgi:hypothetical protein
MSSSYVNKKSGLSKGNFKSTDIVLISICIIFVGLSSSFGRPIWIDEFLHFALGGFSSSSEAWGVIRESIKGINHGQTGVYMLLDYWLLKIFGANLFWLRFPSIFSAFVAFLGSIYLFNVWKMSFWWRLIGIFALFSQSTLLYYAGEARPYMPLVAATICTLLYYSIPTTERNRIVISMIGWFSVLGGILFHPYFPVYWFLICSFTYLSKTFSNEKLSVSAFVKHCDLPLSIVGSTIFFSLGKATWLQGRPNFKAENFDPFQWVSREDLVNNFVQISHLQFFDPYAYWFLYLVFGLFLISVLTRNTLPLRWKPYLESLIEPASLIFVSMGISILLGFISYYQTYWILPRQWVASIALCSIASVWLANRLFKFLRQIHIVIALLWMIFFSSPILINTYKITKTQFQEMETRLADHSKLSIPDIDSEDIDVSRLTECSVSVQVCNDKWVELANTNIRQGGKVWEVFSNFYGKNSQ